MAFDLLNNTKQKAVSRLRQPEQSAPAAQEGTGAFRNPQGPMMPRTDPPIPSQQGPYQVPGDPGARSGVNPNPTMPQPAGGFDFSNPDGVRSYFQSIGVTPYASSPDYWSQKWHEWGKNDPAYYKNYLSKAEEITGGPQQTAQAMGWGGGQQQQGGGGNLGWLLQLLGSRLQQPQQAGQMPQAQPTSQPQPGGPQVDINAIIQQALTRAF